jgi:hypothetical protein
MNIHARVHAARHAFAARNVFGEDRPSQAEVRVIGERHGFVLVLDPKEERDWPEELLLVGGIVGCDIRQNRRLHEGSRSLDPFAAHHGSLDLGQ